MSNIIANHLYVYGPRDRVNQFFAEFLRDGLNAHVTIPPEAVPATKDPERTPLAQVRLDRWGTTHVASDVYWKFEKAHGVALSSGEWSDYIGAQLNDLRSFEPATEVLKDSTERPGYRPPLTDATNVLYPILYLKFYTPWTPPSTWFGQVATESYHHLRFLMQSSDLTNIECGHDEIWSVEGPGPNFQHGHWAMRHVDPIGDEDEAIERFAAQQSDGPDAP